MKRILVLYKELAGYFIACLDELCLKHDVQADVIAYPVNADAPFEFKHSERISISSRASISDQELSRIVAADDYDLIFTGGWFDKGYLAALKHRKCPALLGFDNSWNGSLKQQLSTFYGRMFLKPLFEYAFVPGSRQAVFASKLGFQEKSIIRGAYSCDVSKFSSVIQQPQRHNRLIYAGRYSPEKYVQPLFELFHKLAETEFPNWELHCIGTGPLWNERLQSPHIVHHGFMQPDKLLAFMSTGNAFVLPSTFEPWGVAVHEFAAAGYPLILSDAVGAAEAFLETTKNGYLFQAGNKDALEDALRNMMSQSQAQLLEMGLHSLALAFSITPESWATSVAGMMR
jgi:glycosyltransferase involved in cell wall biosynthesis